MSTPLLSDILEKLKSPATIPKGWLLKRLKALTPQDFSTLMEFMTQTSCLPLLVAIDKDFSLPRDFRTTALEIRKRLGDRVAPEEERLLEEEQGIRHALFNRPADKGLEENTYLGGIINRLVRLPEPLAKAIIQDLVKEKGEAVLPFLKMVYQKSADNYALMALEVLATIEIPESKDVLQEVAATEQNKLVQKFAKKLLYRLRGVAFPAEITGQGIKMPPKSVLTAPDHNIIKQAWVSFIDGQGNRLIHLLKSLPMAQMQFITLLLSDTQGIMDCQAGDGPKKVVTLAIDKVIKSTEVIEIPPAYAMALIAECQEINKKAGQELPREFLATLGYILTRKAEGKQGAFIYQEIPVESVSESPYFLHRSSSLLELKEFGSWLLPAADLERYLLKLREIEQSLIIVSEYLQRERVEEVYQEIVREFFSPEKRAIYRGRLEEMAYFLWATERQEEARLALAAALGLGDMVGDKILEHPFAKQLVYRSIEAVRD